MPGYECAVYSTSGIEVISRARVEHLTEDQRLELAEKTSLLESLVSGAAVPAPPTDVSLVCLSVCLFLFYSFDGLFVVCLFVVCLFVVCLFVYVFVTATSCFIILQPPQDLEDEATLTRDEKIINYFNRGYIEPLRRRQKLQSDRCQKFKARVWLTENHPLSLQVCIS